MCRLLGKGGQRRGVWLSLTELSFRWGSGLAGCGALAHSISSSGLPCWNSCPSAARMAFTTPSLGATTALSIFIACIWRTSKALALEVGSWSLGAAAARAALAQLNLHAPTCLQGHEGVSRLHRLARPHLHFPNRACRGRQGQGAAGATNDELRLEG